MIPHEVENQLTYLSEENHRLNTLIQKYIDEIKNLRVNVPVSAHTKIEFQIPPEVQNKIAFLAHENERLNAIIIELQSRPPIEVPSAPRI